MINFLNKVPIIEFMELDMDFLGCKTQYQALWEVGTQISAQEYQEAWKEATKGDFDIRLQGRRVGS